jgi:hypothetical protein
VRVVQPRGGRRHDRERVAERHVLARARCAREDRAHVLAVDVLHRDEVLAIGFADVVDLHDVLVMQGRGDARLVEEHADEALIAGVLRLDPLDHDMALEALHALGAGEQHVSHTARGEVLEHRVTTKPRPHCRSTGY